MERIELGGVFKYEERREIIEFHKPKVKKVNTLLIARFIYNKPYWVYLSAYGLNVSGR